MQSVKEYLQIEKKSMVLGWIQNQSIIFTFNAQYYFQLY